VAVLFSFIILIISFLILLKSADFFVDGAVGIADSLRVPKMLVGIVLVGFCTTAPEFAVSVQSAWLGHPEIALGNAIGSVICDDALALALAATFAPVIIDPKIFKTAAPFLITIDLIAYAMAFNGTISRWEGLVLVAILVGYLYYVVREQRRIRRNGLASDFTSNQNDNHTSAIVHGKRAILRFIIGLIGVIISSRLVIISAVTGMEQPIKIISIVEFLGVPEIIIGLTMIAIGTSLPEIMTCVVAAKKKQSEIAAGDIIGADILNILWIIGVSAAVNPMSIKADEIPIAIHFPFISMLIVVITMLIMMRTGWTISRKEGIILVFIYVVYISLMGLMVSLFGLQISHG
jgi:cation:H+ antiporter